MSGGGGGVAVGGDRFVCGGAAVGDGEVRVRRVCAAVCGGAEVVWDIGVDSAVHAVDIPDVEFRADWIAGGVCIVFTQKLIKSPSFKTIPSTYHCTMVTRSFMSSRSIRALWIY